MFAFANLGFGIILTLIGFKIYNPFKGKNQPEKEREWYSKFGNLNKYAGIALIIFGAIKLIGHI